MRLLLVKRFIFLAFLLLSISIDAQTFGERQVISNQAEGIRYIQAGDIDGDGFVDIIAAIFDKVVWYRNIEGSGDFEDEQIIGFGNGSSRSLAIADLDNDGDQDVIYSSIFNDLLLWYENLDGAGSFSGEKTISTTVFGIHDISTSDIDGDGDLDLLVTLDQQDRVQWLENLDGQGNFGPLMTVTLMNNTGRFSRAADLDSDGDMDVATVSTGNPNVVWMENLDGMGDFSDPIHVSALETNVQSVFLIDMDNDNDVDILSAKNAQGKVELFENMSGTGDFILKTTIQADAEGLSLVQAADLDNDGDQDVFYAATSAGVFSWHENLDGTGESFGPQENVDELLLNPRHIIAAYLDNDGDQDLIGAVLVDQLLLWYENLTILNSPNNILQGVTITPNPTTGALHISSSNITLDYLEIRDIQGKLLVKKESPQASLSVKNLNNGVYFVIVRAGNKQTSKRIIKQ